MLGHPLDLASLNTSLSQSLHRLNFGTCFLHWPLVKLECQWLGFLHHCIPALLCLRVHVFLFELWFAHNHLFNVFVGQLPVLTRHSKSTEFGEVVVQFGLRHLYLLNDFYLIIIIILHLRSIYIFSNYQS